ncbi:MAG: TorF family putative porin, partial [Sphingorhabdus sp.]
MRKLSLKSLLLTAVLSGGALSSPAFAQEAEEEAKAITLSGSAAIVSDYRFRGISQTDKNFAVQAGLT